MSQRRLALLRHAKSSWDDPDLADHDRPLNPRGRRAGAWVGQHLRSGGTGFDLVLCSSAVRTIATLSLLELDRHVEVRVEPGLYGATAGELLDRLRLVSPSSGSVLLIAHNPGIHELAVVLTGDHERIGAFPTAALAELSVLAASWADLRPGAASLDALVTPPR
jgi:phosphohistidine phosphatase